jgi:hypothetical protein
MIAFKKHWLTLASTGLIAGISAFAAGCFGPDTFYYDYLNASGTVYQADARAPLAGALIQNYDWIVSYTDRSTVAVSFNPAVTTDAAGQFNFDSSNLSLQSGNLSESCTDVCVEYETQYEDYCSEWTTETGDEYCADWEIDSEGDEYCADWETSAGDTYCSAWSTDSYEACVAWGQDCDYYYPARDIGDISEAYAEITYSLGGGGSLVTQSSTTNYPATSVQKVSTKDAESGDTTVDSTWLETDNFTSPILFSTLSTPARTALTANQTRITAERNATRIKKARKITQPLPAGMTSPRTRLTRKDARKLKLSELSNAQMLKVETARNGCGASPKSSSK